MARGNPHVTEDCRAIGGVLSRVGDKWSVLIVSRLGQRAMRFNELKREIGGISQRMLTLTLRGLERDGLVTRTIFATIPPRVDYELTALGKSLIVPVGALGDWARKNIDRIAQARAKFDQKVSAKDGVDKSPKSGARSGPKSGHSRSQRRPSPQPRSP